MLFFRDGMFVVGPESAGAHPGPTCYKKGGPLTVTDANLCLGRLVPEFFPKIFGPNENEPLDLKATLDQFDQLTQQVFICIFICLFLNRIMNLFVHLFSRLFFYKSKFYDLMEAYRMIFST